jgi:hypothetical protein
MTRLPLAFVMLAGLMGLAGCPEDKFDYETWTDKLDDSKESERAVTELDQLGNPKAIAALGQAWQDQGKPGRILQVIISLARPLTPEEAKETFKTDYEKAGRPASWDKALPFLIKALAEVDDANPRSVDSAGKAADALGDAGLPEGLDALVEFASRPLNKKLITAQVSSVRAIGKYSSEKAKAAAALIKIIDRDPPPNPRSVKQEESRSASEKFNLHLALTGSAINALGDLHVGTDEAAKALALAMYRTPELFTQIRRALVATGPAAKGQLTKILDGTHAEVNQLFKDKKLDRYCGDKNTLPPDQCQPVSAKDFYPAVVLGDFYDDGTVKDLLEALKRPPQAVYYMDDQASPNTQYNAIFDALRKIGSPTAASAVYALWSDAKTDLPIRAMAISAYPFLTRDGKGTDELAKIAADNKADDQLRQEAATAFARLATDAGSLSVLEGLADKYFKASDEKRKEADGKPKAAADAADKVFEKQKKDLAKAESDLVKLTNDKSKTAEDITKASADVKAKKAEFKVFKTKHKDATAPYKQLDGAAKAYLSYARMFQTHIARIEIAIRCKQDLKCFAKSLELTPAQAATNASKYIKDIKKWTDDEKKGLAEANVERAMLEIGKAGKKAWDVVVEPKTGDKPEIKLGALLLDQAVSDSRLVRQSILLALPKIAPIPCESCEPKLDAAIKAGEGKSTLGDLNLETTMLRNYFSGVNGGKTAAKPVEKPTEAPAK